MSDTGGEEISHDEPTEPVEPASEDYDFHDNFYFDHPLMSEDLVDRIRASLAYHASIRVSLDKINTEWEKKMRFSILEPCKLCGISNHVDVEGVPEREDLCCLCQNKENTFTRTEVYRIKIPIGVRHGSTILLKNKGHIYDNQIQGNIVVTFLDEPHEHFLRVEDDIIVCFQIDRFESVHGVTRILNPPGYTDPPTFVIKTERGIQIKDNDVFLIKNLGLKIPTGLYDDFGQEVFDAGNLYVVFFVRSKGSTNPIKLNNLRLKTKLDANDTSDTVLNSVDPLTPNGSPADSCNGKRLDITRSPRKRKRSGESKFVQLKISKPEKVPPEFCQEQPPYRGDLSGLSFRDRLINNLGAIPLPFRDPVWDEISIMELESLWRMQGYKSWWQRFEFPRDRKLFPDYIVDDANADEQWNSSPRDGPYCSTCSSRNVRLDIVDDSVDTRNESVKQLLTENISGNPNHLKFLLKTSLPRCKVIKLMKRVKQYLADPEAEGRM